MEKFIFEKRPATASEKAITYVMDLNGRVYNPRYLGEEEAQSRLPIVVCPCVFVTKKNGYIPVKYRSENYIVKDVYKRG